MATAKRKHLLAAAIILLLRRSRKRFSKWENRRIWILCILRRETHRDFQNLVRELSLEDERLQAITVFAWRNIKETRLSWPLNDQICFFHLCPKPRITAFCHFEKSCDKMAQHDRLTSLAIRGDEHRIRPSDRVREKKENCAGFGRQIVR